MAGSWIPSSASLVHIICVMMAMLSCAGLIFGRDYIPITHGTVGIVLSFEGVNMVRKQSSSLARKFFIALIVYSVASVLIGLAMVDGRYSGSCDSRTANIGSCKQTYEIFGAVIVCCGVLWLIASMYVVSFFRRLRNEEQINSGYAYILYRA